MSSVRALRRDVASRRLSYRRNHAAKEKENLAPKADVATKEKDLVAAARDALPLKADLKVNIR